MQACSFGKFCLGTEVCATGLTALDTSTSSIEREYECHAGPHPKLERDLQQEVVEGGRQPLTITLALALEVARTATNTVTVLPRCVHGASGTSFIPSNQVVNASPPL